MIIDATISTSPNATKINAIIPITIDAFLGSLCPPSPFAKNLLANGSGKQRSMLKACNVLGATRYDPIAEDIVEAARPSGTIIHPNNAIFDIINWSESRASGLAEIASL